jgi:hypothetical protein
MAKQAEILDSIFLSEGEALTDEDKAALREEAAGKTEVAPPAPEGEPEGETAGEEVPAGEVEAKPGEEVETDETPATPEDPSKPKKKLSRAQERISELASEKNALKEERERYQKELLAEREKWARLEERTKTLQDLQRKQYEDEQARVAREAIQAARAQFRPDPNLDPQGAELFDLKERTANMERELHQRTQQFEQTFAQTRAEQDLQRFKTTLETDVRTRIASDPSYTKAAEYATAKRQEYWRYMGATPEQAKDLTDREALGIAAMAIDRGLRPTDAFKNLATTWGYKDEEPAGQQATPAGGVSAKDKLAMINKGQKHTGLSGSPNMVTEGETDMDSLTPEQFATASEEQYLAWQSNPATRAKLIKKIQQWEIGV